MIFGDDSQLKEVFEYYEEYSERSSKKVYA